MSALSVASGVRHSRPGPATWIGICALSSPQALPMGDFQIGGIGQEFRPPCPSGRLSVFLGSDSQQNAGINVRAPAIFSQSLPLGSLSADLSLLRVCTASFQFLTEAQCRYVCHYNRNLP